ncbi:MAG: hypothetical protein JNK45_12530 [Myxococcales bacterium]|nr:hypothetical protein [Myxococcales bacterium]
MRAAAVWSGAFDLEAGLEQRPEMQQNYRELRRHRREACGEIVRWFETHRASDRL